MIEPNNKIILHIPEYFHDDNGLIPIPNTTLNKLYVQLQEAYYDFYITTVETYYKNRTYTTKLVTIYTKESNNEPINIFKKWFKDNNNELHQESLAYEHDNKLRIEEL